MRSLPELKQTPVFVLTALDNREYHEAAKSMIQGYYLKTQIRPMELIQKVREYLESH
jgi:DNA-binding NarL/FixJ family response regulator